MKIYLAHNFAARLVLRPVVERLTQLGHEVTSRWITDDAHVLESTAAQNARDDLDDVDRADALVIFTDQFAERPGRGKFVELGYAMGKGKRIYLCGVPDPTCVFYNLQGLRQISIGQLMAGNI